MSLLTAKLPEETYPDYLKFMLECIPVPGKELH